MTEIKPRNDFVLIQPDEAEKMKGSLYLPETYTRPQTRGTVAAVGPGYLLDNGQRASIDLTEGDRVEFLTGPGMPVVEVDGEPHLLLKECDIVGLVHNEPAPEMALPGEEDEEAGAPLVSGAVA